MKILANGTNIDIYHTKINGVYPDDIYVNGNHMAHFTKDVRITAYYSFHKFFPNHTKTYPGQTATSCNETDEFATRVYYVDVLSLNHFEVFTNTVTSGRRLKKVEFNKRYKRNRLTIFSFPDGSSEDVKTFSNTVGFSSSYEIDSLYWQPPNFSHLSHEDCERLGDEYLRTHGIGRYTKNVLFDVRYGTSVGSPPEEEWSKITTKDWREETHVDYKLYFTDGSEESFGLHKDITYATAVPLPCTYTGSLNEQRKYSK
ncbi:hypothetical protein [Treponema pectinovorum]|uniref:hypothetical protein n=1 Tax=Treponema pectinovorum TaxID=164 RepID=UPI0011C8A480|nr:hypothetical protein [Treponema pectinovorum]